MENQHRKISGYRELSQAEIDLMNEIKAFGPQLEALVQKVFEHVNAQHQDAFGNTEEVNRMKAASPTRWADIGRNDLQTGLMALTRAIAQPTFF